jgi:hypothetical protein
MEQQGQAAKMGLQKSPKNGCASMRMCISQPFCLISKKSGNGAPEALKEAEKPLERRAR